MRKGLKLVATVLIVAVVALLAIVALAPIMIESRKDDLLGLASRAVGEPITAETLELALLPPGIRVGGLGIGSPALVSAGEVAVDFELLAFLRKGRLHLSVEATDLTLDLARETTKSDESDSSASAFELPMPVEATVLIENLRVGLSEDRQVTARRLGGELAAKLSGDATLRLDGESLELIGRRQTRLDTLHAEARFVDGTVLIVERFDVGGPDLVIKGKAASASSAAAQQLVFAPVDIEAAGELGPVLEFFVGETGIEGQASIAIELSGALADPEVEGDVRLESADLGGFPVDSLAARARRLPGGLWKAGDLVLERPEGRYTGSLTIDENSLALSAQLSWTGIDLAAIVDSSATWRPTSSGAATLSIDLDHFRLVASGGGSLENRGRAVPFNAHLETDGSAFSGNADLALNDSNRLLVRIDRADQENLIGKVELRAASIVESAEMLDYEGWLPSSGGIEADASLSGTIDHPAANVTLSSSDLRLADGSTAALRLQGDISGDELIVHEAALRMADGSASAVGRIALGPDATNDWELHLTDVDIERLASALSPVAVGESPILQGVASGDGKVTGPWSAASAAIELAVSKAAVRGIDLGDVKLDARAEEGRWSAEAVAGGPGLGEARVEVAGAGSEVDRVEGEVRAWPLARLAGADPSELSGVMNLQTSLTARDGVPRGRLDLAIDDLRIGERELSQSKVEAIAEDGSWRISGQLLNGQADLVGRVEAGRDGAFELGVNWNRTSVPLLLEGFEDVEVVSRGSLKAGGSIADRSSWRARLDAAELSLVAGKTQLAAEQPVRVDWEEGKLRLAPLVIAGNGTRLAIDGDWSSKRESTLRIRGRSAVDWVARFTDAVEDAKGAVDLTVDLTSTPGTTPRLSGKVSLGNVGFSIAGIPPATEVRGEIELLSDRVRTKAVAGEIGGGRFSIAGDVDFARGPDLRWSITEMSLEPAPRLEMVITGKGKLSGAWQDALLEGDIRIVEMLYDRNLELQDLLPTFGRAMKPAPERRNARPPLRLDLRISARDSLHIENNIAVMEGRADLAVGGTVRRPSINGSIEALDGQVIIRGRTFEVVNAVVGFQPQLAGEASIDFLAESVIESAGTPYQVQVRAKGTTDNLRIRLESNDGLSQTDIASLIAFGKTVSELQGGSAPSASALDQVAALAGGQLGNVLAGELEEVLPFDQIEFRAGFSSVTGEFEPQIRLGKTISNDLSAWLAQSFGVQPQTTVEMAYALTQRISALVRWQSQTDKQQGAIGGEIAQRIEFWELPAWFSWGSHD